MVRPQINPMPQHAIRPQSPKRLFYGNGRGDKYCNPMTHDLSALKIAFPDKPDSELTKMQESAQKAANERKLFCQRLLEKKAKVEQDKKLAEKLAANKLKRK